MARKEAFQRTAERGSRAAIKGRPAAVGSLKRRRVERLIGFIFVGHVEHRQDRIEAHPFLCGLPLFRLQLPRGLTQPSSELLIAFGNSSNRCQSAEAITATNLFSIRFKAMSVKGVRNQLLTFNKPRIGFSIKNTLYGALVFQFRKHFFNRIKR
jgi:hypothetical protein